MTRPIRGIVIKEDRKIGGVLITGDARSRYPLIAIGLYHRGQGASKVYYSNDIDLVPTEGIDVLSLRAERPADYPIVDADPNTDKLIYGKITNRAEMGSVGAETGGVYGVHFEVDQRAIINDVRGGRIYTRQRSGGSVGTLRGFEVESKIDHGTPTPTTALYNLDVRHHWAVDCPATESAGIRVRAETDGNYVHPKSAILLSNKALSSHRGFKTGINYESDALQGEAEAGTKSANIVIAEDGDAVFIVKAAAPSDGDFNDLAKKGCLLIDMTNARLYMNVGTKAATDWDYVTNWT